MVGISDLNPLSKFDIGAGSIGNALILFVLVLIILGCIGWLIWWRINSKRYFIKIPLYRRVGNTPTRISIYKARIFPISKAGDILWFVKGVKKFIAPATIQSAPNEFMHWEREDGELVNFGMGDLDEAQKKAGVKYIHQDMRSQRIATSNILEQRLINKGFWEKYKDMIVHLIFYIVVMICLIVIFWQWGNIVDRTAGLVSKLDEAINICKGDSLIPQGLAPSFILLFMRRRSNIKRRLKNEELF